jgi:hypothetical protein
MTLRKLQQVRLYTLQCLSNDTTLMTPLEEVFSRRGGVKMIIMELEQLRSTVAQLLPLIKAAPSGPAMPADSKTWADELPCQPPCTDPDAAPAPEESSTATPPRTQARAVLSPHLERFDHATSTAIQGGDGCAQLRLSLGNAPADSQESKGDWPRSVLDDEPTPLVAGDGGGRALQPKAGSGTGGGSESQRAQVASKVGPRGRLSRGRALWGGCGDSEEPLKDRAIRIGPGHPSRLLQSYGSLANSDTSRAPILPPAPARPWGSWAGPDLVRSEGASGDAAGAAAAGQRDRSGAGKKPATRTDVVRVTLARRPAPDPTFDSAGAQARGRSPLGADNTAGRPQFAHARRGSLQPGYAAARAGLLAARTFAVSRFEQHLDQVLAEAALDSPPEAPVGNGAPPVPSPPPAAPRGQSASLREAVPGGGVAAAWMPRSTGWRDWRG